MADFGHLLDFEVSHRTDPDHPVLDLHRAGLKYMIILENYKTNLDPLQIDPDLLRIVLKFKIKIRTHRKCRTSLTSTELALASSLTSAELP